ncbi:YihY/virulence factor BrkB family protein [Flexivirga meconopsidis]|uniref:YihY/virulence factor BrkB family protein n=1 Tax=Flexivirga meconopsidis TaxID=2977121 RepID=UPI00223FC564|nr:YihY/virulence factor BrkB family protein [Flexivirga meconopsidis]
MGVKAVARRELSRVPGGLALARLVLGTIRVCMRYRVTGLAAESGFFALLSLPPLIFGLLGAVGYLGKWLGPNAVGQVTTNIETYAAQFLTEQSLRDVLMPTINSALGAGRPDVISVGFLLSLWSGSRALNVTIDTVSIMYGQGGHRGIIGTRLLSLSLYLAGLVFGAIVIPLIVIGPDLLASWLPPGLRFLMTFYWPLVGGLTILSLATLFYIATPSKTPWVRDIPGATLTLVIWVGASMALRWFLGRSMGDASTSIYGPLAATIVVLTWLYFLGIAVLIGAAMNAASVRLWPPPEKVTVRDRAAQWIGDGVNKGVNRLKDGGVADLAPLPRLTAIRGGAADSRRKPAEQPLPADTTADEAGLDSRRAIG